MAFVDGQNVDAADLNALGAWTDVAHSAGNFTASAGTWTVASGDQITLSYSTVGKTMILSFTLNTTSVSATPSQLRIAIPGSNTVVTGKQFVNTCRVNDNGTERLGLVVADGTASTYIYIVPIDLGTEAVASWTASTNNTLVQGQIAFEIT